MHEATFPDSTVGVRLLEDWSLIRVSGDDAREWLNGQISNSVATAQPGRCIRALVISNQGRIEAELWVHDRGDELDLVVPTTTVNDLLERFDRYIVMEDVDLNAESDRIITLQGPRAGELIEKLDATRAWPCPRLHPDGYDLLVPKDQAPAVLKQCIEIATTMAGGELSEAGWELYRLRHGVPRFGRDFGLDTYPREVGLVESAVAFDKGCYVGQEAVVMLQHRGKPPRLLAHLRLDAADDLPTNGTSLTRDGQDAGTATSVVADPNGGGWALALVRRKLAQTGATLALGETVATVVSVADGDAES